jgi:hypothetical protein
MFAYEDVTARGLDTPNTYKLSIARKTKCEGVKTPQTKIIHHPSVPKCDRINSISSFALKKP